MSWREQHSRHVGRWVNVRVYLGSIRVLKKLMKIRNQTDTEVIRDALAFLDAHHYDLRLEKSRGNESRSQ